MRPHQSAGIMFTAMLLACSAAGAQNRVGGGFTGATSVRQMQPMRAARVSGSSTGFSGRAIQGNRQFMPRSVNFNNASVPGLGFDYVHLAAISGNIHNGGGHGRGGRGRLNSSFTPIFFGGYPYYSDFTDTSEYPQVQQQPQIIVIQQPAPAADVQQAAPTSQYGDQGNLSSTNTAAPVAATPVRDVGDLILVRRDGKILFASVFTVIDKQLQYVTPEGIRHAAISRFGYRSNTTDE
jgi:hypothetical protein